MELHDQATPAEIVAVIVRSLLILCTLVQITAVTAGRRRNRVALGRVLILINAEPQRYAFGANRTRSGGQNRLDWSKMTLFSEVGDPKDHAGTGLL
jgi:hypothetical protein